MQKRTVSVLLALAMFAALIITAGCAKEEENQSEGDKTVTKSSETAQSQTVGEEEREEASEFAEKAYTHFLEVSKIPRGSGNEQAISDYLTEFGNERGFETVQDDNLNVLIKKPGSEGREDEPAVILQAHMDMVCEKNDNVTHNFKKDPIIPVKDGDWITSGADMTLGADDGAGLGMLLAVLDAENLSHPPIEAVITTGEEVDMGGANTFDVSLFSGERFINLDSEEEGIFTVSCAGAFDADITVPVQRSEHTGGLTAYTLSIKGLTGGHSGVDIDKGRANANVLTARLLRALTENDDLPVYVSQINGGSARNAIPRECEATIAFVEENLDGVNDIIDEIKAEFLSEFKEDKDMEITLKESDGAEATWTEESLTKVLDGILNAPDGVISMSEDMQGLVQTSNNIGVIETEDDTVILVNMTRSSDPTELSDTKGVFETLADSVGAKVEFANDIPAWPFKKDSPLCDKMSEIFNEMYGKEPSVEATHGGLECGLFAARMPDSDFVSIGPDIEGPHSPGERMSFSSFNRVSDYLVKVLAEI